MDRRIVRTLVGAALGALAALTASTSLMAQNLKPVSVIVFPGGFNWPILVAQQKGFFARNGIEVRLTNTPNSVFQLTGLIEGRFDIGMTAIDNVIAYQEGQGEAPVNREPDLFAFMGADNGFLSLVTVPEVKSFADLKGRVLSVDALTTGYAFVLLDLLDRAGLKRTEFETVRAGGVLQRWDELKQKKQAGTMLITPFDIIAQAIGFNVLQRAIDVYGHYQGLVGATRREWAKDHSTELQAYVKGYVQGLDWLKEAANKEEALTIFRAQLPQMSAELAAKTYDSLVPGFTPKAKIDLDGVAKVLELRSRYGEPKKTLTNAAKYYDGAYYEAALK